ncbi:MAG: DNA gyrase inhibitor YacG [Hyphomonadaceae bacterium]
MSEAEQTAGKCVICGKPKDPQYKPFCSKRCADVDLNRWFSGGYRIPAVEDDEPDDDETREN